MDLAKFRTEQKVVVKIKLNQSISSDDLMVLKSTLIEHKGYCQVMVHVSIDTKESTLLLPIRVAPSEQMCDTIMGLKHVADIGVVYPSKD